MLKWKLSFRSRTSMVCGILATACAVQWAAAPTAQAQPSFVESFYVSATSSSTNDDLETGLARCSRSFGDALTQSNQYIERNSPEVVQTVSGCVANVADPATQRACDLAAASSSVDYILMVDAMEVSSGWLFEARAVSPTQNGTVWSADQVVEGQSDFVLAARQGCRDLAANFLCTRNNVCPAAAADVASQSVLRLSGAFPTVGTVYVDGVAVGNTMQAEFALTPGSKRVEIRAPGYATVERVVELAAGQTLDLADVQLEALPATASVACNVRGATIRVNGQEVGTTALGQFVPVNVPVGASTLSVEAPGYTTWQVQLAATPGADLQLEAELMAGTGTQTGTYDPMAGAGQAVAGVQVPVGQVPTGQVPAGNQIPVTGVTGVPTTGAQGTPAYATDDIYLWDTRVGALQAGDSTLTSGEYKDEFFYYAPTANHAVAFHATSAEFDTYLMIRGPGDFSLDNDDFVTGNLNAGIDTVLPTAGEYRVIVTSYQPGETGSYQLAVVPGGSAAPVGSTPGNVVNNGPAVPQQPVYVPNDVPWGFQTIGVVPNMLPATRQTAGMAGGMVDGNATTNGQCRGWYEGPTNVTLSVAEATDVRIFAESTTDLTMILMDAAGNVWCDDDTHGNLMPELTMSLVPGNYDVFIGTYASGTTGEYVFTLETLRP